MRKLTDSELYDMAEALSELTLAETFKLINILANDFGIKIINNVVEKEVFCMPGDGDYCEEEEELKNVYLIKTGPYKLQVVKTIKDLTGLGLKESKDIADRTDVGMSFVKTASTRSEAEYMASLLMEAGATVEIR